MNAEIHPTKEVANTREREFFDQTKSKFKGTKYCDVFKHPTKPLWAVPCDNTGRLAVKNAGVELTDDWFPDTEF